MEVYYGRKISDKYVLEKQLGGGGEGKIYSIQGKNNLVAKIYFDSKFKPTQEIQNPRNYLKEKIQTMLEQPVNPYINNVLTVAWPQDILFDKNNNFVGYVMPRVNSKYHIYSASRQRERVILYPNYTWKTALIIAYNLALCVRNIHDSKAVIGDFNPNNIMINEKGYVTLIDTDSFNITNIKTGKIYKCGVGVSEVLAPELQGKNLSKPTSVFSEETDNFSLAIHIFNLIMNNCHPFGCIGMNKSQSSSCYNAIVYNITKGKCPYVTTSFDETSPDAPDIMMLPYYIRQLFDRAFSYDVNTALNKTVINNRPTALEWQNALKKLINSNFSICKTDNSHVYPSEYGSCPWCAISNGNNNTIKNNISLSDLLISDISMKYSNSKGIRRSATPLWFFCIAIGCIVSPFMYQLLIYSITEIFEYNMSINMAKIILFILGGISGCIVSYLLENYYIKAYNGWPYILLGILSPLVTVIVASLVSLVIYIIIVIISAILYLLSVAVAVAIICGCLSGG